MTQLSRSGGAALCLSILVVKAPEPLLSAQPSSLGRCGSHFQTGRQRPMWCGTQASGPQPGRPSGDRSPATPTPDHSGARGSPLSRSQVPRPRGVVKPLTLRGDSLRSNGSPVSPCTVGPWWGRGQSRRKSPPRAPGGTLLQQAAHGRPARPARLRRCPTKAPTGQSHLRGSRGARMF